MPGHALRRGVVQHVPSVYWMRSFCCGEWLSFSLLFVVFLVAMLSMNRRQFKNMRVLARVVMTGVKE